MGYRYMLMSCTCTMWRTVIDQNRKISSKIVIWFWTAITIHARIDSFGKDRFSQMPRWAADAAPCQFIILIRIIFSNSNKARFQSLNHRPYIKVSSVCTYKLPTQSPTFPKKMSHIWLESYGKCYILLFVFMKLHLTIYYIIKDLVSQIHGAG
jgi:hypothetical protein